MPPADGTESCRTDAGGGTELNSPALAACARPRGYRRGLAVGARGRAAANVRSISNYVSYLVVEELKRKGRRRLPAAARPGDKRRFYAVQLYVRVAERKRLEAAAKAERRSVSGYVGRVIVAELS